MAATYTSRWVSFMRAAGTSSITPAVPPRSQALTPAQLATCAPLWSKQGRSFKVVRCRDRGRRVGRGPARPHDVSGAVLGGDQRRLPLRCRLWNSAISWTYTMGQLY